MSDAKKIDTYTEKHGKWRDQLVVRRRGSPEWRRRHLSYFKGRLYIAIADDIE